MIEISEQNYLNVKFGLVTVIACIEQPQGEKNKGGLWLCRCQCGNEVKRTGYRLSCQRNSTNNGCGCLLQRVRLTPEQETAIVACYESGKTIKETAAQFGLKNNWVWEFLQRKSANLRNGADARRIYPINNNAFSTITEQSAYWSGFLMADGCVQDLNENWYVVTLALAAVDKAHVEMFRDFISPTAKVESCKSGTIFRVRIRSTEIAKDLAVFGIGPRKSFTAKAAGTMESNRHFWRGAIDGDGCVRQQGDYHMVNLVGSKDMMEQFADYCGTIIPGFRPTVSPHSSIWVVSVSGRKAITIIKHLYGDCTIALARKWEQAKKAIADDGLLVTDKPLVYAPHQTAEFVPTPVAQKVNVTLPVRGAIVYKCETLTITEACAKYSMNEKTLRKRLGKGLTPHKRLR